MPFTVTCSACNSRFLLGDDLFRRKVSGKVVTVKCRTCNAEISVDASEPATLPSNEAPLAPMRAHPAPPRPHGATGTPLPGASATGTPLPKLGATGTPLPKPPKPTATGTPLPKPPLPRGSATQTPVPTDALLSIWDAAEKNAAPRKPPPPQAARDAELIVDFEEAPPSSSDAPTLSELKHEASPPKKPKNAKKAPDDFLVNLSAGTGGIVGAPSIDVSSLVSPPPPEVEDLLEVEATELTPAPAHKGTVPLFDMSAVLPAANEKVKALNTSLSPSHVDVPIDDDLPVTPSQRARERKNVVAPAATSAAAAPKNKRGGGAVWFVLVAAAAGVVVLVGMRGRAASSHATPEPEASQTAETAPGPRETKATTDTVNEAPAATASAAPPATSASATAATSAKPSSTANATTSSPSVKSADASKAAASEPATPKPETAPAPAIEKPAEAEKPAAPAPKPAPEPAEPGTEFDRGAAVAALKAAAAEASACRKDGDPSGTATLTITFAPSGRVTSANIQGPPFAGTPTGGCIANAMRHAHVPAFSGDRVTVNKTIVVQ